MQEVRERRPDAPEQTRDRPHHPQLLASRGEAKRLDTGRHKLGPARDRREAKVVRDPREGAQQLLDVRLVTRSLPTEDVRVDHDERSRHEAASPYAATVASAIASQLKASTRRRPRSTSSSRCEVARSMPAAIAAGSRGSTRTAAPSATSSVAPPRLVTTGVPQAIASSTGIPKPSYNDG